MQEMLINALGKILEKMACKKSSLAYYYARNVDKELREETWLAVKGTEYEEEYKKFFNNQMKEEII